ncbi:MAG: cation:proton antiporter [Parahaliea sp.]
MYQNLAIIAVFAFLYSVVAGRIERSFITGPMIYVTFGLLVGAPGLGILNIHINAVGMRVIADMTLALVLFIDAANADLRVLRAYSKLPERMLLIGLPLSILLGVGVGVLVFPSMGFYEVCVLATMLAATDAALGKSVVSNPAVPAQLRQGINVESGLNDGMAVPVLLIFLALASGTVSEQVSAVTALKLVAEELLLGTVVGLSLVGMAVFLMKYAATRSWFNVIWAQIPVVTLSLSCFAVAQTLGGSGFIACFAGGLLFGYLAEEKTHGLVLAAEGVGELLCILTWVIFAAVFMGIYLTQITWDIVLYAVLSVTVIRIIPVLVSLWGCEEPFEHKLFLAWFGPRGLASIVFLVIVGEANLPSQNIIVPTVVLTITLCIVLHGLSANSWADRLARRKQNYKTEY